MSFILESIKQAERERKLGQQQAPAISIEYTGSHVDNIEKNKMLWILLSLGLIVTAILVWGATNYFTNKDRQYIEELSTSDVSSEIKIETQTPSINVDNATKHNIAMVPVKNLHKSDLKSVKLIADDEPPIAQSTVKKDVPVEKKVNKKPITNVIKNTQPKAVPVIEDKINDVSDKHELVSIYSDLAAIAEEEKIASKPNEHITQVAEELVQIETASYVAPSKEHAVETKTPRINIEEEINRPKVEVPAYKQQHEKAVRSGVPSFGELPYEIKEKIPDFNVSVHMFHADPVQRRIRINGQMYTEGKSLQQDLALVEITRYGAVFDYQGQLFRFSVR